MKGLHKNIAWLYDQPLGDVGLSPLSRLITDNCKFWVRGEPERTPFAGTFTGLEGFIEFERRLAENVKGLELTPRYTVSQQDRDGVIIMVLAQVAGTAKSTGRIFSYETVHEWRIDGAGRLRGFADYNNSFDLYQAFAQEPVDASLVFRHPLPDDVITPTGACAVDPAVAVERFYEALLPFDVPKLLDLFDDNAVSQLEGVEGVVPFSGTYRGKGELTKQLKAAAENLKPIVGYVDTRYVVEGNRVCARFSEDGTVATPTGKPVYFLNLHCFTVTDEGRIRQFRSYNHTYEVWRAFTEGP